MVLMLLSADPSWLQQEVLKSGHVGKSIDCNHCEFVLVGLAGQL